MARHRQRTTHFTVKLFVAVTVKLAAHPYGDDKVEIDETAAQSSSIVNDFPQDCRQ